MNIIVGTAGHIDHGKTTLIKALTGTDTDRLPEEKKRGITIDLGFAELDLGEHRIGFVDVPGHERFVKNMLAGASGIDLVLLIIAADEGVMPQTREHFDICRLLGVNAGLVVLTKRDVVDEELLELVELEVAELVEGTFLEGSPVIAVSSTKGEGLDQLRKALTEVAGSVGTRRSDQVTRLPIDRSFVVKGFGTVATGTLASGSLRESDELELMPEKRRVRVRGLQSHGKETATAAAGQRVAVNLAGVDHDEVARGMTLAEAEALEPVQIFDARVEVLKNAPRPLRSRQRVRVHIGTAEALARVRVMNAEGEITPGSNGLVQLRLEAPVTAVMGERFIIRNYSPQITIAGGSVIDPTPTKHRGRDTSAAGAFLEKLEAAADDHHKIIRLIAEAAGTRGVDAAKLQARTGWQADIIRSVLAETVEEGLLVDAGGLWTDAAKFAELKTSALGAVNGHHKRDPLSAGMSREALRDKIFGKQPAEMFRGVLASLEREGKISTSGDVVRSATHSQNISGEEAEFLKRLRAELDTAGLEPAKLDEIVARLTGGTRINSAQAQKLVNHAVNSGDVVKVSSDFCFSRTALDGLIESLRNRAEHLPNRLIDVPSFKDIAGISRKFAIPLLEYFDRVGVTKRAGDKRIIV